MPQVWTDMESVLAPRVRADPTDDRARALYAYWAWRCGQWKTADAQLRALGPRAKVWESTFGGKDELESIRAESAKNAGAAN